MTQYKGGLKDLPKWLFDHVNSFENFEKSTLPPSAALVRAFLRYTLQCTELFRGDGYTYDPSNEIDKRGVKEFLFPRSRISELPNCSSLFCISDDVSL